MARLCLVGAIVLAVLLLSAGALLVTSSSSDANADAVEQAIRAFEDAVRDEDIDRLQTLTTPEFYKAYLKLSGSASIFAEDQPELALPPAVERRIQRVTIRGDQAMVAATIAGSNARNVDAIELRLVRRGGAWLLDGTRWRKTDPPGSAQVIEVTMRDHDFVPDPLFVRRDTTVVFRARNTGAQPHMIGIWTVPADAKLILIIEATEAVPDGVERIVQSTTFAPGDEGDITVSRGLRPGRYMLTCFLSDITSEALTPHYDIGMLTEFEVK